MKHLRSIEELGKEDLLRLLESTAQMAEINRRPIPKVPALRGKTVDHRLPIERKAEA